MNKKIRIKNNLGFAHHALLGIVVVAVIVVAGIKVHSGIHAQTAIDESSADTTSVDESNIDTSNPEEYHAPKGNPALLIAAANKTVQSATTESTSSNDSTTSNSKCTSSQCLYYVLSYQAGFTATGASALMSVAKPHIDAKDSHTLVEMAVFDRDINYNQIEVGWTVSNERKPLDGKPRLFVFHWVNGNSTCYNGCGFVRNTKSKIHPGSALTPGTVRKFTINYNKQTKQWQVFYNGDLIGYFPAKLWKDPSGSGEDSFTHASAVALYGEVAYVPTKNHQHPHSQMGNGKFGSKPGSSLIKSYKLINSSTTEKLIPLAVTDRSAYDRGNQTNLGMNLGGPGFPLATP